MENPKICDICQGSGEVSYFKGESRFLISNESCPACNGSGFMDSASDSTTDKTDDPNQNDTEEA